MSDRTAIEPRLCLLCSGVVAHDCDEMICGYLCQKHLDDWLPWGGYVEEAWERFCEATTT